jgi:peptidoglycan/LPS O-acetylase OafA/YrhL
VGGVNTGGTGGAQVRQPSPSAEILRETAVLSGVGNHDTPRQGSNLSYIPALDGIRGLAIIVIMGYHAGVFFTSGGFYSLDAFFTLSGFLITSLLIAEWHQTATIRLRLFWARRARRLLPALLVMVLVVTLYCAFFVPSGTYPHIRSDGIAALFYFANWHFIAAGSNYFAQTAPASPLTHTWSLAVEEQFYLVWPLIFLGVVKLWRSKLALLLLCIAGALASAIEMACLYSSRDVNRLYYGTDTRAQSLLIGSGLAVALSMWADRRERSGGDSAWAVRTPSGRAFLLVLGLAGVTGSVVLWTKLSFNDSAAYRGGFLLAALATSAILLSVVCSQQSLLARAFSFPPLRYIGKISYGLYLWYYPMYIYVDNARTGLTGYPLFFVRGAATLTVAVVSFYVLELPIRKRTILRGWKGVLAPPVAIGAVVIALFTTTATPALATTSIPVLATRGTLAPVTRAQGAVETKPPIKVLWVGDSTAFTLAIGMSLHQDSYGIASYDGAIVGCGVTNGSEFQLKGVDAPMATACQDGPADKLWPHLWLTDIALYKPNVVIILAGRWEVVNRTYDGRWTNIEDPSYAAYVKQQLEYAVQLAGSGGAHVILMTAPCYDTGEQPNGDPWPEDSQTRLSIYNQLVRQVVATSENTSLINFNAMACPGGHFEESIDGKQVRDADGIHFTFGGGNVFAPQIWPLVVALANRQLTLAHAGWLPRGQ